MSIDMRRAWNQASATYQTNQQLSTDHVSYGPGSPTEAELHLLGTVRGMKILDLGCGGGQNAIALARHGAWVAGIDLSDEQLAFARALAVQHQLSIDFVHGNIENLAYFESEAWDLVFSTYTFQYVSEIGQCLAEANRVLGTGGRLVFSLDHPFRTSFYSEEDDELVPFPTRNYFDNAPLQWSFLDSGAVMVSYHRTLEQWISLLSQAGFQLERLLESLPDPDQLDATWPIDGALAPLRNIPQTLIFVTRKI